MSGVRIKNLESASEVIEKFDEFEFAVDISTASSFAPQQSSGEPGSAFGLSSVVADAPKLDATLKLSGKDLKKIVAAVKHTHPIQEVEHLPEELNKKPDKAGGTIADGLFRRNGHHLADHL